MSYYYVDKFDSMQDSDELFFSITIYEDGARYPHFMIGSEFAQEQAGLYYRAAYRETVTIECETHNHNYAFEYIRACDYGNGCYSRYCDTTVDEKNARMLNKWLATEENIQPYMYIFDDFSYITCRDNKIQFYNTFDEFFTLTINTDNTLSAA